MRVRAFNHAGITVGDFDRAVAFYGRVFGCELLSSRDIDPARVRAFYGVGAPEARGRLGLLHVPGGALLEIFAFTPAAHPAPLVWARPGVTHLAFEVRSVAAWHARLRAMDADIVAEPTYLPGGPAFLYVRDPDGTIIELVEPGRRLRVLRWIAPLLARRARRARLARTDHADGSKAP
jgi:catechol 2,3-dioxygenase-like lactoylglutathione lyase family enzyme